MDGENPRSIKEVSDMAEAISLKQLGIGELAEIVELDESCENQFGIDKGMSVVVLQKAVEWLVQVGYNQISLTRDMLERIKVVQI